MKRKTFTMVWILLLMFSVSFLLAQNENPEVEGVSEAAEGLDLQAVSELFKESETLESFEKDLNDPEKGINNLDLDENGEVDFISVVEEVSDETHLVVLQVSLGEDEYQDVATIEIEKTRDDATNLQIHGNEDLYGEDYYVEPSTVYVHTWPIVAGMYKPAYRPYRSRYYFGFYPRWWKPWRPVTVHVYRPRVRVYHNRAGFRYTRVGRVRTVNRVVYKPRSSKIVRRKVVRKPGGRTVVKKTVKKPGRKPRTTRRAVKKK